MAAMQLKQVAVSKQMQDGAKCLRWDEDSAVPPTVTLRVDAKGHLMHWQELNGDTDYMEISRIRDTRVGKSARVPKDSKLRDFCSQFGGNATDYPLEERCFSVIWGLDLVNLQWVNFVALNRDTAQLWCQQLFALATSAFAANPTFYDQLERAWTKLIVNSQADGTIAIKSVCKLFASHKDDQKRVESALAACQLLSAKPDFVDARQLSFDAFLRFYSRLCPRLDIDQICRELNPSCRGREPHITLKQFAELLNEKQRDPRLNEILHPYCNEAKARELIQKYEPDIAIARQDQLSSFGLQAFLISADSRVLPPEKLDISQDMDQPLAHYFINSSHNTYLTGHQLTGKSSVEIYRQVLLTGCRCVELDCWDGKGADEEPVITHGYTMCTEVPFRETIEAIAEAAFKASDYPVILSFENHCSPKQQVKMAKLLKDCLGELILTQELDSNPLKPGVPLPSPEQLRGKFLIKNKKLRIKTAAEPQQPDESADDEDEDSQAAQAVLEMERPAKEGPVMLSEMVNYMEPVRFCSFQYAAEKNVSYECSSVTETKAVKMLNQAPEDFVRFNKRQISRIYPRALRVDSSNFVPQMFWNAGCQLVALNFQTLDLGLQLNLGVFHHHRRCGYLLKPDFMRRPDRRFDPFSESTVDGIVANSLSVRLISGHCLSDRRVNAYAEVEMYGLPADTVRKRFRTRTVTGNGLDPQFSHEAFVFKKVVLPQLATLRISVSEESGKLIGQRFLPVDSLRPGYRHIPLFTELMQPLSMATLFVYITVNDYVPDASVEITLALANSIQFLPEKEKRLSQLMVLTDDFDVEAVGQLSAIGPSQPPAERAANRQATTTAIGNSNPGPNVADMPMLSLDEIWLDKEYQKLVQKGEEEIKALAKKNQKELIALRTKHRVAIAKLESTTSKKKLVTWSLRRHKSDEAVSEAVRCASEREFGKRAGQLSSAQEAEVRAQLEAHASAECSLRLRHSAQQRDALTRALTEAEAQSRRHLQTAHAAQREQLKQSQERQRSAEARQLARQLRDRAEELREARRGFQQKQIVAAVSELQALDTQHARQLKLLLEQRDQLALHIEEAHGLERKRIDEEHQKKLTDINKAVASGGANFGPAPDPPGGAGPSGREMSSE